MELLLEMQELVPTRAEALYIIADHYNKEKKYTLAGNFILLAERIPMPPTGGYLFTERLVYEQRIPLLASHALWWAKRNKELF